MYFRVEGCYCVFCQSKASIIVDHPGVEFGVCDDFDCHVKLAKSFYDPEESQFLIKEHRGVMLNIGSRKVFFKNDKRIMKGLPNKVKEVLNR